jgi:hypothetical protein
VSRGAPDDRPVHPPAQRAGGPPALPAAVVEFLPATASSGRPAPWWRSLARLAIAATLTLLLGAAALALGTLLWTAHPDDSVRLVNGRQIGEARGYVARVDRQQRTVAVSRSVFGWQPIVLTVNPDTLITVQDREGGLGDLVGDMLVRVTFELVGGERLALAIEIGGSESRSEGATAPVGAPAAAAPAVTLPAGRAVPSAGSPSAPIARRVTPEPAARGLAAAPVPGVPPAPPAPRPPAPEGVREAPGSDPAAVIDWLIKQSRRR